MAYPFHRTVSSSSATSTPQTPQAIRGIESPRHHVGGSSEKIFFATPAMSPQISRQNSFSSSPQRGISRMRKVVVGILIIVLILMIWCVGKPGNSLFDDKLPNGRDWDWIPYDYREINDYFNHFEGYTECGIKSTSLYFPTSTQKLSKLSTIPEHSQVNLKEHCPDRRTLLKALSSGDRVSHEHPYNPLDCHYRWYTTPEICMILERFDAVVFVGDSVLQTIYAAFNVLLRENLATGARLESKFESVVGTETEKKEMSQKCRCSGQVERTGCADFLVRNSDEFLGQAGRTGYHCTRTPHYLLPLTTTPTPEELQTKLTTIFDAPGPYSYKPIAIIHSLTEPLSVEMAASSLDELIDIVTSTTHASTAFLSIGPNANTIHYDSYSTALLTKRIEGDDLTDQGEIRVAGSEDTNDARQRFTWDMEKEAEIRGIDSLSMWNLTVVSGEKEKGQHESKGMDGLEVGIVQAMMVINWLSRLPST